MSGPIVTGQIRRSMITDNSRVKCQDVESQELIEFHTPLHNLKHSPGSSRLGTSNPESQTLSKPFPPAGSRHMRPSNALPQNNPGFNAPDGECPFFHTSTRAVTTNSSSGICSNVSKSSGASGLPVTTPSNLSPTSSPYKGVPRVIELEKDKFVAPELKVDPRDVSAWEERISPRLHDTVNNTLRLRPGREAKTIMARLFETIHNTLRLRPGCEAIIAHEFMMGGTCREQLAPTIVLTCSDEKYRKPLEAVYKQQGWLRECGYNYFVLVDEFYELSFGTLDKASDTDLIQILAAIPNNRSTLCSLKAQVQARSNVAPVRFTIGGILLIDNKPFGLTVRHVLEKPIPTQGVSPHDNQGDVKPSSHDYSSKFFDFERQYYSKNGLGSSKEHVSILDQEDEGNCGGSNSPTKPSSRQQVGHSWQLFGHFHAPTIIYSSTTRSHQLDWSLVSLDPRIDSVHRPLTNTIKTSDGNHVHINEFLQRSAKRGSEVWINAGSTGLVKGWLMDCLGILHHREKTFQVLQVIPDKPLAPGDSGSWVLMGNVLCGHVLLSRKSVPWLYVIPMFDILTEIKTTLACQDVALPQSHSQPDDNDLVNEGAESSALGSYGAFTGRTGIYGVSRLWHDLRNPRQWHTWWGAVMFLVYVCLCVLLTVISIVRYLRSSASLDPVALRGPSGQPSEPTSSTQSGAWNSPDSRAIYYIMCAAAAAAFISSLFYSAGWRDLIRVELRASHPPVSEIGAGTTNTAGTSVHNTLRRRTRGLWAPESQPVRS